MCNSNIESGLEKSDCFLPNDNDNVFGKLSLSLSKQISQNRNKIYIMAKVHPRDSLRQLLRTVASTEITVPPILTANWSKVLGLTHPVRVRAEELFEVLLTPILILIIIIISSYLIDSDMYILLLFYIIFVTDSHYNIHISNVFMQMINIRFGVCLCV